MNLFDNIIQSQFNNFTGKQAQPQVPSFGTPEAPRTMNYTQPNILTKQPVKTAPVVRNGGFAPWYEWTVDETKSPVNQFLQWGADLYTGIQKRLWETVQADKVTFDTWIQQKQQSFVSDMLAKGHNKEDIFKALDTLKSQWEFDFKPWISESIVWGIWNRMQSIWDTTQKLSQIQNPLERTVSGIIPYAGQTVATVTQPIASAIEPYVSPVVKAIVEKTGQTQNIQDLSNQWSQFEKTNPILAENIAGLLNASQVLPVPFAKPIGNAIEQWVKTGTKAIVRWAEVVAPKIVQGIKTGVKATEEWIGKITKSIVSQQSGLWTPSIESILKNPELQWKIRSWELSAARTLEEARTSIDALREWFRETGKMYDTIRKSDVKVSTNEAKQVLLSQLESERLATGWKLNLVDLPVKDRWAITQALKYIDEYKWEMTPQSALSIRQKLDDLINYKSDVGSNWQRIVTGLRAKYDEFLSQKLPWLKEIDAKYAPERQFWESIRKDIYKADGTLKDNALSVISNITNKGNEAKLARMESILPWIWEKVKALRAFEDIQASSGIKVWTYARNLSTVWLATVNPILAVWAWVATHPVVVSRVLESIGLASQKIKSILSKWKNITKEDATIIQQAVAKTPKSKVESIINNLSYDPKTSKLTSKTLIKNANNSVRPVAISNKWDVRKVEQVKKPIINPKNESKVNKPTTGDTTTNIFGETIKKPSNKKGGFIKIPEIGKKVEPLIEEAKKYKSVDDFINSQPKLYRWQKETMSSLKMNNPEQKSNTLWDAFHFTTDIELAKQYWKIQEIPFQLKDVLTAKEVEKITSDAQVKLDKLVSKWIYEWKEYDMLEELAIWKYPDIAKHLNKPFIKTWRYNDTEILYFPKYDTTKSQLKQIYNQSKSIVKNPLVEEARKRPKSIIKK